MIRSQKASDLLQTVPFRFNQKEKFPGAFLLPLPPKKGSESGDEIATGSESSFNKTRRDPLCSPSCRKGGKENKIPVLTESPYSTFFSHGCATFLSGLTEE